MSPSHANLGEARHRSPDPAAVAGQTDRIEAELKALGLWQASPPSAEKLAFNQTFAQDTMAFHEWLQFVFLPRVRDSVASVRGLRGPASFGSFSAFLHSQLLAAARALWQCGPRLSLRPD